MNAFVGNKGDGGKINAGWMQFLKDVDFRRPAEILVVLDEHPDSINDGWFIFCTAGDPTERTAWSDLPASYHNGAAGFSFADGHSEIRKWRNSSTLRAVKRTASDFPVPIPNSQQTDITWVAERATHK